MRDINEIFDSGELFDGHYKLIDLLSTEGGSADVWLAIDVNTIDEETGEDNATKVVIKVYRPKNMIDIEGEYQFRSEFKKVFGCHHENIIQPTYFSIYEEMPYLVLPYCPSGSSELLVGQIQEDKDLWKYIYEVASGLAYLHEHTPQIIHQDIKPANVLIDDNGNYAITDFGISAEMGGADAGTDENGGTFAYMAPERFIEGTPPMPESDIWALGATLYELITGDVPYGNDGGSVQKKSEPVPPIKQKISDDIRQLIYSCLSYDAASRPTARSIVDTVLKKRYSRSRKMIAAFSAAGIIVVAAITALLTMRHASDGEGRFDSLVARADSIVTAQAVLMGPADSEPSAENVKQLENALLIFNNVINDAPADYASREEINARIDLINRLVYEINEYELAGDLAEKARVTEMEQEYIENSLVKENHRTEINQIIKQLK